MNYYIFIAIILTLLFVLCIYIFVLKDILMFVLETNDEIDEFKKTTDKNNAP